MILWWLWACTGPEPGGTAVGNPGDMDVAARIVDQDVDLVEVEVPTSHLVLWLCGGGVIGVPAEALLDGLGPSPEPVEVPPGPWCGLDLVLAGPVSVAGATQAGTAFTAALDVGAISLLGEVTVDGEALLLELPIPVDAAALDALGPAVDLQPDDALALDWAAAAARDAVLVEDVDEDGFVALQDPVLARATLPDTAFPAAYAADAGCTCGTGSPRAGWWGGLLLLVVWRRRSDASPAPSRCRVQPSGTPHPTAPRSPPRGRGPASGR